VLFGKHKQTRPNMYSGNVWQYVVFDLQRNTNTISYIIRKQNRKKKLQHAAIWVTVLPKILKYIYI
jgi:hypothetical protein